MAIKQVIIVVLSFVMVACADTHSLQVMDGSSAAKFGPNDSVLIGLSKNGEYGEHYYASSGFMVSKAIQSELLVKLTNVAIANQPAEYNFVLQYAESNEFDYLIYPTILHWEDRSTEWSSKPDKMKVKISVIDVKTQEVIKSGVIEGKSGLATFGGDHPQDLLPEPVSEFMASLVN
ncbi:DUF4823 domain-containing protein [Vibrio amylolyticus]|uniref:DUF4823 domain-containing protein n=1 Tax=Vibrio amylolyticus TaxID=2847292 RepID=UPI00354EF010